VEKLLLPLLMCILFLVLDFTLPTNIRLLAGNIFRVQSEDPREFYRRYRVLGKVRIPIGIALAILAGSTRSLNMSEYIQAGALIVNSSLYGIYIVIDMFRARLNN
jgi:hypothetical protein